MSVKISHPVDIAVGSKVREIRIANGMSQTELGRRLGVSFQQVQKYENGTNRMGSSRLIQICEALKCTVLDLFDGIDSTAAARHKAQNTPTPEHAKLAYAISCVRDPFIQEAIRLILRSEISKQPASNPAITILDTI